ncbi:MAG TPA: hypothetical protein VFQ33_10840 [Xanthobacteraceae bacterium]|nr:hypothetical protein [Xanthobacteraceae bacterium]
MRHASQGDERLAFHHYGTVLIAGGVAATAAPLVPSGDLPGRERYRFTPSLDRFMQPSPRAGLLLRWDCGTRRPSRSPRARHHRYC